VAADIYGLWRVCGSDLGLWLSSGSWPGWGAWLAMPH